MWASLMELCDGETGKHIMSSQIQLWSGFMFSLYCSEEQGMKTSNPKVGTELKDDYRLIKHCYSSNHVLKSPFLIQ